MCSNNRNKMNLASGTPTTNQVKLTNNQTQPAQRFAETRKQAKINHAIFATTISRHVPMQRSCESSNSPKNWPQTVDRASSSFNIGILLETGQWHGIRILHNTVDFLGKWSQMFFNLKVYSPYNRKSRTIKEKTHSPTRTHLGGTENMCTKCSKT